MTVETLAAVFAPFVAVLGASAWLHTILSDLKSQIATLTQRVLYLERELERMRAHQENTP
jgi:lipid II:glycine glycyltransferase (peptidoglycan interpeptide bridge formation enzyme)